MLVCTADRPPELHGVGAPQTIDQQQLYGARRPRRSSMPGVPDPSHVGLVAVAGRPGVRARTMDASARSGAPQPAVPRPAGRTGRAAADRARSATAVAPSPAGGGGAGRRHPRLAGRRAGRTDRRDRRRAAASTSPAAWPALAGRARLAGAGRPRSGCRRPDAIDDQPLRRRPPRPVGWRRAWPPRSCCASDRSPASKVLASGWPDSTPGRSASRPTAPATTPTRTLDALLAAPPGPTAARLAVLVEQAASAPPVEPTDEADEVREFRDAWIAGRRGRGRGHRGRPRRPSRTHRAGDRPGRHAGGAGRYDAGGVVVDARP